VVPLERKVIKAKQELGVIKVFPEETDLEDHVV